MATIMTTKEVSEYLKLHEITICKYADEGIIPAAKVGRIWRFDRDVIDIWINGRETKKRSKARFKRKGGRK